MKTSYYLSAVRSLMITAMVFLVLAGCSHKPLDRSANIAVKPMEREVFIVKPLGYEPTIKGFRTNLPSSFKLQVYSMRNVHNPSVIDTIYRFYHKNSQFLVYKNLSNREMFFAGNIYTPRIQLRNGVKVGMSRDEFFHCFLDLKPKNSDTIRISSKHAPNSINFIFKDNTLKIIKIDNYID